MVFPSRWLHGVSLDAAVPQEQRVSASKVHMHLPSPDAAWPSSRRATASPEPRDRERSADGRASVPGVSPGSSVPPVANGVSSGKKRKCA